MFQHQGEEINVLTNNNKHIFSVSLKTIVMTRFFTRCILVVAVFLALGLTSCHKFSGPSVPAYIHIESISVDSLTDYSVYGASTSNITDAWVYVDDQIIGCYELPATFPVLEKGEHKVAVYGGICLDGRGSMRAPYSFYMPVEYKNMELVENQIDTLRPVVNYYPINEGVKIAKIVDFESSNPMESTAQSDTGMVRVVRAENWPASCMDYVGGVSLPAGSLDFTVAIADEFKCHKDLMGEKPLLLEMDYNTNDTVFVGIMYYEKYTLVQWPMVKVLPTDKQHDIPQVWKKIYINLGSLMHEHESADYFKVYITSDLTVSESYGQAPYSPLNEPRHYYFDNLKVLYK